MRVTIVVIVLFMPFICYAEVGSVVINEVCWMGTSVSANDEWIELKNTSSLVISLNEWQLKAEDGTPSIELKGKINANSFFILERTDDSSCAGVKANIIYKGVLSNSGETLVLLNNKGEIVDRIEATNGWPAGNNETKQTMERKDGLTWQTSAIINGTPNEKSSDLFIRKKEESVIVSKDVYTNKADKRFMEAVFAGLTSSFCFASLTLMVKKGIKRKDTNY